MELNRALVIENPQIDFFMGGALEVANSDTILPILNQLIASFTTIIVTLEWHPANHISFAANHPWRQIGQVITQESNLIELKPIHCVQNTFGALIHPTLSKKDHLFKIYKGTSESQEDNSAFFDKGASSTALHSYLQENNIQEIYVAGMILEDNILATLMDGLQLDYKMHIFKNACCSRLPKEKMINFWKYIASNGIIIKEVID